MYVLELFPLVVTIFIRIVFFELYLITAMYTFCLTVFQYPVSKSSDRRMYVWGLAETGALGIHMTRGKKGRKQYRNNFTLCWHPMRSSFAERFDVS